MTNTTDSSEVKILWLGLDSDDSSGQITLFRSDNLFATDNKQRITLTPYGISFNQGIDVAIADVSYQNNNDDNENVTNVITIQRSLENPSSDRFTVKVFDGNRLIEEQVLKNTLNGEETGLLIREFTPFLNISASSDQIASVASGDIDGDGFSDIVVGLGGEVGTVIEVYSGKNYNLLSRINPFHHEQDFKDKINLAVGDVNGDGFEDIIVGQGSTGRGLVEVYSGLLIKTTGTLNGIDTAHTTTLISHEFQPYGAEYEGEVDVTSGYILQRPDTPNGFPVQTNKANLITLAKNDIVDCNDQIQVFTFLGESVQQQEDDNCSCSHDYEDFSLDASLTPNISFTPTADTQGISGTFADLPGLPHSPVLFTRKQNGEYEIIYLGDENEPEFRTIVLATDTGNGSNIPTLIKNPDNDIFVINGGENSKVTLKVTLTGHSSSLVNELGVFYVDDAFGTINGIAPGTAGYAQAALVRSKVILSVIANNPNGFDSDNLTRLLELESGTRLRFLLVKNSTINSALMGVTSTNEVLFAESSSRITELTTGEFSLDWKDGSGNNVNEFQALSVKIKATNDPLPLGSGLQGNPEAKIIDLTGLPDSINQVEATFTVYREAAFNNFVGFYQIADAQGSIDVDNDGTIDFRPGDSGYLQAAVNGFLQDIALTVDNQSQATYERTFTSRSMFAPFIIANSRPEAILDGNPANDPLVYFAFLSANPGKVEHIRLLGNNIFGFEDLPMGGDMDFNDIVLEVEINNVNITLG